jgi:hydrogenase maturation protein HypF
MNIERAKVTVRGAVQGVGFRPFVYRLAAEGRLKGWVLNSGAGVFIEVEGEHGALKRFLLRLEKEAPPRAIIRGLEFSFLDAVGYRQFEIRESEDHGAKTALISPDTAPCADCRREILDPGDRRHRYAFTNCTNCGPRFTIIEALPYDRPNTSMRGFAMCDDCAREYHDPMDRRFHAQPNACPQCGPQLEWWDGAGNICARRDEALLAAAAAVRAGKIVALKGVGGFQLLVDAHDDAAVARLRTRKRREAKPFALMYPALDSVRRDCRVSEMEERLLLSAEAPIVLLDRPAPMANQALPLARSIAPGNPSLGIMLPSTPLHHLLLAELGFPVVATSGNLSDEPICIDEREALARLAGIADAFLVHNRPIVRHLDDSVVRVVRGREMMLRRSRGYAPLPVHVPSEAPPILALGAHLKNSVALSLGAEVFVSQHIGDLETGPAFAAFRQVAADLPRLYDVTPAIIACDLHPDYLSSKYAAELCGAPPADGPRLLPVQHHWAHILACMAENELTAPVLGVAWDGTGYGPDGTVWGGEFLFAGKRGYRRVAHLRQFRLPGGETAVREPRRSALGVLWAINHAAAGTAAARTFSGKELALVQRMLSQGLNSPLTSSAGRLFDAVASILDLRQTAGYEGQAAMELEFAAQAQPAAAPYVFDITDGSPHVVDWQPMIAAILDDLQQGQAVGAIAARFHVTMAEIVVAVAQKVGEPKVVLTGGCFQNRYLIEQTLQRLEDAGFRPYWHQRVPPNDGGIALGQVVAAMQEGVARA